MAVLIVYPIKYGPVGNSIAPITSPNTFINTVHFGPNHIAQSIVGINAKLIFIIGVFIDKILDKIIKNIEDRLSDKDIHINVTEEAKKYIIDNSYDEFYGARPIKRYVSENIETLIARSIIENKIKFSSTINIDVENNHLVIK